jgi:chromatin segregation and condensation protein Rec8/ScpA/Scc1 (kleisin family)
VLEGREGQGAEAAATYRPPIEDLFLVPELLARLRDVLGTLAGPAPFEALLPELLEPLQETPLMARSAASSTFLAILELVRGGEIGIDQAELFGPIAVFSLRDCGPPVEPGSVMRGA